MAVTMGLAVVGGLAGFAVAWTSTQRPSAEWAVWALVVTAMTAAAGAAAAYGVGRWHALAGITPIRIRDVVAPIATVWVTAALFGAAFQAVTLPSSGRWEWRAGLLVLTVGVGVLPAMGTIAAGGAIAAGLADADADAGSQHAQLVGVRRILQGVLAALGGIIALLVLSAATAARMNGDTDPVGSVLFGGFMSALVAIVYLPAAAQVRGRGIQLLDEALPTAGLTGTALAERVEQRGRLEASLGIDRTLFSDLQTNVAVLGPLITSAAAALLSR